MNEIISVAPGRVCLFGDHQDYLGLPIIACAINRYIKINAVENGTSYFTISMPDINKRRKIKIDAVTEEAYVLGDHLKAVLKVVKRYQCNPNKGFDITFRGNIPINAGTSSSSAIVVAWANFLLTTFGCNKEITSAFIAEIGYQAEVVEQKGSGGRMDQFSIGLGNIIYLETDENFSYKRIEKPIEGLILGESGIPKDTLNTLKHLKENAIEAIKEVSKNVKNFDVKKVKNEEISKYLQYLPAHLRTYFIAAVSNYNCTKEALKEFDKESLDLEKIGALINVHHNILKNQLEITVPRIDDMISSAIKAGAYGAKIVGSGKGGSIVAISPKEKEAAVIKAIKLAGGINAYKVSVDIGARILSKSEDLVI